MHGEQHLQLIEGGQAEMHTAPFGIVAEDRAAYCAWTARNPDNAEHAERFTAAYCGAYTSPQAWALELVASMEIAPRLNAVVPEWFRPYLDVNLGALAADMERSGEIYIEPNPAGGIWVFDARTTP